MIMRLMHQIARGFAMTDQVWDRHANPWSGWTRFPILPAFVLVLFFRDDLGRWTGIFISILILWTWVNPRLFPRPTNTRNWMSQAVFGERIWLDQANVPIPSHHAHAARVLSLAPLVGLIPLAWGLVVQDAGAVIFGTTLAMLFKMWFLDRMVWLFRDMAILHPVFAAWLIPKLRARR